MRKVVVAAAFMALTGVVAAQPVPTQSGPLVPEPGADRSLGYTKLNSSISELPGQTAWPGCSFYDETDSRLPVKVIQYLAKQRPIVPAGYTQPIRTIDICRVSPDVESYFVETAPAMAGPGVCAFNRYQLDPADVGGRELPGIKIGNYFVQTLRSYMQLAKRCPSQRDKNYISTWYVSGGLFGSLETFWRSATRSPTSFKNVFSQVPLRGPNSQVVPVTSLNDISSAITNHRENLRLMSVELDTSSARAGKRTAYILRVSYLRPTTRKNIYNPFTYSFYVDVLRGGIVPLSIVEEH
jgi:hypothetical protein